MKQELQNIFSLFRTYKNPLDICFNLFIKKKLPIKLKLRNKHVIIGEQKADIFFLTQYNAWKYCKIQNDILIISQDNKIIKFKHWRNSEIPRIFFDNEYGYFDFEGKTVVDIGANIGDSTIYFLKNGAK